MAENKGVKGMILQVTQVLGLDGLLHGLTTSDHNDLWNFPQTQRVGGGKESVEWIDIFLSPK